MAQHTVHTIAIRGSSDDERVVAYCEHPDAEEEHQNGQSKPRRELALLDAAEQQRSG